MDDHTLSRTWQLRALSSLTLLSSARLPQAFISEAYAFLDTPFTASPLKKSLCEEPGSQNNKGYSGPSNFSLILTLSKDIPFYQQPQCREHTHVHNFNSKTLLFFLYFITFKIIVSVWYFFLIADEVRNVRIHYLLNVHWPINNDHLLWSYSWTFLLTPELSLHLSEHDIEVQTCTLPMLTYVTSH